MRRLCAQRVFPALSAECAIFAALAAHAAPLPEGPRPVNEPRVNITTIDPRPTTGKLLSFSIRAGAVLSRGSETIRIPTEDIVRISFAVPADKDRGRTGERAAQWSLVDGDEIRGHAVSFSGDGVTVRSELLGAVRVPVQLIKRILTPLAKSPGFRDSIRWFDQTSTSEDDAALLTNGDVVYGLVRRIDADGLVIDSVNGEVRVPQRLLVAARLANPSTPAAMPAGPSVTVVFKDGGRLTFGKFDLSGAGVEAVFKGDEPLKFPVDPLERIDVSGGRWQWLSTQSPVSYEHTPMLGLGWEYQMDHSVVGTPLCTAGQIFDRGIGVHSRSTLVFELKGQYREFVTQFGLDDTAGNLADVAVAIVIDGQRRHERTHVRPGELIGPVRLDVTKANRLELTVDYGDNGDMQDRFNWIEPGLIR